jgi:glycosyltransferase involved in cell wall biosynthesis
MVIALLTTDNREDFREYHKEQPWFGPAPQALLQGFESLPECRVHVVSCAQQPVASPEKLAPSIWFHSLQVPKIGWMRTGYQGCIRACRKKLREIEPDIVHGQGTERDCAMSASLSGFPNVVTIHGNMAELARVFHTKPFTYPWLAARFEAFALRRTSGVFCNSAYTEHLVAPRAQRVWRVANPIRELFFAIPRTAAPSSESVITNIGVISPRKRQLELLDVAARLQSRGLKFRFDFVGACDANTDYGRRFMERVAVLKNCVRYVGTMNTADLIAQLDASSALVHFPMEEAFGLVVCEALARGLKFFGASTGGIIDIADGLPGAELLDVNDWNGLENALASWISAGAPRPPSVVATIRERFHPSAIARQHVSIYRELLSTRS